MPPVMGNLLALSPLIVLLLGAIAARVARPHLRLNVWVNLGSLVLSLILVAWNAHTSESISLLPAAGAPFPGASLVLQYDGLALFFSAVVLVSSIGWRLISNLSGRAEIHGGQLIAWAGAAAFFASDNWPTLAAAWLLVDLGLLIWRIDRAGDAEEKNQAWTAAGLSLAGLLLFLFAGAPMLNDGSSLRLSDAGLGELPGALVLIAAWIRSGLYPFHAASPAARSRPVEEDLSGLALTALLGLVLLARMVLALQQDPAFIDAFQLLAFVGIGATALLCLRDSGRGETLAWSMRAIGAPAFLTVLISVAARAAFVIWLGLGLYAAAALIIGVKLLHTQTRRLPVQRVLWALALACAAGLPLTPGFFGRVGYYAAALEARDFVMLLALFMGTTLALVPLWMGFREARDFGERALTYAEYGGIAVLVLPVLLEGIFSFQLAALLGGPVQEASAYASDALIHPGNLIEPLLLLVLMLLPLPLAFGLAAYNGPIRSRGNELLGRLQGLVDLSAFGRAGMSLFGLIGVLIHELSGLIEQYPVGWLVFAAIWIALWLFAPR